MEHDIKSLPVSEFDGTLEVIEFNSVTHVSTVAMNREMGRTTYGRSYGTRTALERESDSWSNHKTAPKILALLEACPAELIDRVNELRERIASLIETPVKNRRKRKHRLDAGDELDPVAWVQRDPDGWSEQRKEKQPKRIVRIGVNLVTPAYFNADKLVYRGAAAVAMADVLEAMGHQVEVVAFWAVQNLWEDCRSATRHVIKMVVKASDAPMNTSALTVAMAEIGFSRVVMMPAIARATRNTPNCGMGMCTNLRAGDKTGFDMIIDQDVVTLEQAIEGVKLAMARVAEDAPEQEWSKLG